MTQLENIEQIKGLQPAYLGFIFYDKSPRNATLDSLPSKGTAKRVGVFVNASLDFIKEKIKAYDLDVIQLHGDETIAFCKSCKEQLPTTELWKVFGVSDAFDFSPLQEYIPFVDAFLFDTKTQARGGSGRVFNWTVLKKYEFEMPIIISGGIGLEQIAALQALLKSDLPIKAIDVNSRFETSPGVKDFKKLKTFFDAI
jgi:phosphoribosylanthranilate isomerase